MQCATPRGAGAGQIEGAASASLLRRAYGTRCAGSRTQRFLLVPSTSMFPDKGPGRPRGRPRSAPPCAAARPCSRARPIWNRMGTDRWPIGTDGEGKVSEFGQYRRFGETESSFRFFGTDDGRNENAAVSADVDEVEAVLEFDLDLATKELVVRILEEGIALDQVEGVLARKAEELVVGNDVADLELGQAVLASAEEFTGASEAKVLLGDLKAVGGSRHGGEPTHGDVAFGLAEEEAEGFQGIGP